MSGHTSGPWEADGTLIFMRPPNGELGGGFDIRDCPKPEANARLIASAPDLLEALELAVYEVRKTMTSECSEMCEAAIAKATKGEA